MSLTPVELPCEFPAKPGDYVVLEGDCLKTLRALPDNSVDAFVGDPPYDLTDNGTAGRGHCLSGILLDVVLPNLKQLHAHSLEHSELTVPPISRTDLRGMDRSVRVKPGVTMPEGAVNLQDGIGSNEKIAGASDPSIGRPNGILGHESHSQAPEFFGHHTLQPGYAGEFSTCYGLCRCFGKTSAGLITVPVIVPQYSPLAHLLQPHALGVSHGISPTVTTDDDTAGEPQTTAPIVTFRGTEICAVLRLDLRRNTGELCLADRAHEGALLGEFLPPQNVGAIPPASGLATNFQSFEIRGIGGATHRAFTLYLHATILQRLQRKLKKGGFMGREWDGTGIAFHASTWKHVYRVLKPGGYLVIFGGTRTYHRLAAAVEDAGFEIRDMIHYGFGSGFPKGIDVSRAIDQQAGTERPVIGVEPVKGPKFRTAATQIDNGGFNDLSRTEYTVTGPGSPEAEQWDGYNTALKPGHEPICMARKPLSEPTVAANILRWGVGALNIGACRLPRADTDRAGWESGKGANTNKGYMGTSTFRTTEGRSAETVAAKLAKGRWPANVVFSHLEGCECVGTVTVPSAGAGGRKADRFGNWTAKSGCNRQSFRETADPNEPQVEAVEVWECVAGCPVRELDEQSGTLRSGGGLIYDSPSSPAKQYGGFPHGSNQPRVGHGDTGGASRYFYCAKPSASERHGGCAELYWAIDPSRRSGVRPIEREEWEALVQEEEAHFERTEKRIALQVRGNPHPTVKPAGIMRYLIRLVCPPGGVILDAFAGSGSTGAPAVQDGYRIIMAEQDPDHVRVLRARVTYARSMEILGHPKRTPRKRVAAQASINLEFAD